MARYLTPAKIGLLALIELYTENVVPSAAITPFLAFVVSHLFPSSLPKPQNQVAGSENHDEAHRFILSVKEFEDLLSPLSSASGLPGRTLWDLFLGKLWSINTLDALHLFFERRSNLLVKTKEESKLDAECNIPSPSGNLILISRTSPFGTFIRRSQLEFTRLKFDDTANLWKSFIAYRQATLPQWKKRNPHVSPWSFDANLHEGPDDWTDDILDKFSSVAYGNLIYNPEQADGLVSTDDVEKLLEFQVEQMQKLGSRVSDSLHEKFRDILSSNIVVPSLSHYVKFLESWRAGDYTTSFDNLHRFFDYTMQNRDRLFYQYALLNLAVLQADFGCYLEAVAAMQETVSTARENKDMGCLNFSLSWLYHFGKAHPNIINDEEKSNMLGVEREGLLFLRQKAKETGMWSLWSSSLLSEARMSLAGGESMAFAFENILRSSQLSITKNMMNNIGAQTMLQSSIWSRLGNSHLASSYCEVFLRCNSKLVPFDDILKFTCRKAYLLFLKGQYEKAKEALEALDPNALRSLKASQYWLIFRGILRLKHDLHCNNLAGADLLLTQLLQHRGGDPELAFELNSLHIEALMRRGDYKTALSKIESLAKELKDNGADIEARAKVLIMKAHLFDKCGRTQRGFSVAVRAASLAWRSRLLCVLWPAMGAIANILTSLSEFEASSRILMSVIPRALECEDCALSAQLFSFLADAYMGMAGQAKAESLQRTQNLTKALDAIDRAFAEYSSVEDLKGQCEMMAKKATIMHLVGDLVLANDYAAVYLDLKRNAAQVNV